MKLIPNAKSAPRMWSVQILAAIAAYQAAWAASPDLQALIPPEWSQGVTVGLALLGIVARVIDQPATR